MLVSAEAQTTVLRHWQVAASLPASEKESAIGVAGALAGLHANRLLVAGGANFPGAMPWMGGAKQYHSEGFVFTQNKDGALRPSGTFQLPYPVAYGASCTTPQGVVYAGGETPQGLSRKVILLQWSVRMGKPVVNYLPELPLPLANSAIATNGSQIFLAGGETKDAVSDLFLCLDLKDTAKGWQQLPSLPYPVSHAVLLYHAGRQSCYLAGGRKRNTGDTSTLYANLFAYSMEAGKWAARPPLPYALSAGTAVATNAGLLLMGGDRGETFHQVETLIAAIDREKDPVKKAALNKQKAVLQSGHPGFSRQVLYYALSNDTWRKGGTIPFPVPVTTHALSWNGNVYLVSGEIKAGVRTPNIITAKINQPVAATGTNLQQP